MKITHLNIRHLRVIEEAEITPSPKINLIIGKNGSGKTTLLEAIYLLARAKSFRTNKASALIQHQKQNLLITARIENRNKSGITIGISKSKKETEFRISGKRQLKLSELAKQLPLSIVTPDVNRIVEDGPSVRRKLLNWGVFHVEHNYSNEVQQYNRVLAQRNSTLKQSEKHSSNWDKILASLGEIITERRHKYVKDWECIVLENTKSYSFLDYLQIQLKQGWAEDSSLFEELSKRHYSDKRQGFTTIGPHRADLRIMIGDTPVQDCLSRGQIKILSSLLLFSQADLFYKLTDDSPVLLIDDIQAELDIQIREQFLFDLLNRPFQIFLTSTDSGVFANLDADTTMFHVEQGKVARITR